MKLSNLANVLRAEGLSVVESPGWASRGYAGQDLREVRGVLWHHTATHRSRFTADAPTLSMCLNGRPDLPGPLCQIVFGRSGTIYLLAAGVANHAGAGSAPGVPRDMGNHYLIGIEMESSGIAPWDWTPDQIRVAPFLGAALERAYLSWLPESARYQGAHYEYSSQGKIDPAGWPGGMDGLRSAINRALNGSAAVGPQGDIITTQTTPTEEDDMFSDADRANLETTKGKVETLIGMLDNVAGGVNGVPSAILDKQVPRAGSTDTTSLALFLSYSDADREATMARIQAAITNTPAPELAAQIDAAGLAASVRDELVKLLGGK